MGCWNGTDMITFTPIMHRDPIRMLILKPYGTVDWRPVGPPIRGEYNDYGCIENIEETFGSEWVAERIKVGPQMTEELKSYGCGKRSDVEEACLAVERGLISVYVQNWNAYYNTPEEERGDDIPRIKRNYGVWMVHEETWKAMQEVGYECWGRTLEEEAEEIKKAFREKKDGNDMELMDWRFTFRSLFRYLEEDEFILSWAMNNAPKRFDEIVDELVELRRVIIIIQQTRRELMPVTGCGMQQTQPRAHIAIAELAIKQANKILAWEEEE